MWLALISLIPSLIWRAGASQRFVSFEFEPHEDGGTEVTVTSRVSAKFAGAVQELGRPGRWPHVIDDPDWLPSKFEPSASPQDSVPYGDEDESELDRTTRRARAKERRDRERL